MATKFEGLDNNPIVENPNDVSTDNHVVDNVTEQQPEQPRTPTDPATIHVNVSDDRAPIVLLFGASSSGKTMALVRLAKYLKGKGYSLKVDENFVTSRDVWEYAENCKGFNKMLGTTTALGGTDRNDFLFIKVIGEHGKLICQILEGAGEDYFPKNDENRVEAAFPPYMNGVFGTSNKKIWIFMTEPDWKVDLQDKVNYVERIQWCMKQHFKERDRAIILYNKIDKKPELLIKSGKVNIKEAMRNCANEYKFNEEGKSTSIFELFLNPSPLAGIFTRKYLCEFVPFSTGIYSEAPTREGQHYNVSDPLYPYHLWKTIMDCIKS